MASGLPESIPAEARHAAGGDGDLANLAAAIGLPFIADPRTLAPSADFVERIPIAFARQHHVLGVVGGDERLLVVMASSDAWQIVDVIGRFLHREVTPALAPIDKIQAAINHAFQQRSGQAQALIQHLDGDDVGSALRELAEKEDLLDTADRAPVVKLVNVILFEAVKSRASDVHIQPYEDRLVVRLRIDGLLFDAYTLPKGVQEEVLSRIKVVGRMNIAEKRLPQDGRATVQVGDRLVDLRIASLPVSYGERIVIRLLDKSARMYTLGELGMSPESLDRFRQLLKAEHGMLLVTGPTGSGKSTTLYAALQEIDTKNRNVLTLEDPIEYQLEGISQTQVSNKKGMTFAAGLRSVLRQDPDIIMVGEIRDRETAEMAIQSALTGHLVFSTLHTNDAPSAITRLLELGIEPYLVASSVIGVLAQRLVRQVCPGCARPYQPSEQERRQLGLAADDPAEGLRRGAGCDACRQSGYRERRGVFELLVVTDVIQAEVQTRSNAAQIHEAAVAQGFRTMRDDGIAKVLSGATTMDEVLRITMEVE